MKKILLLVSLTTATLLSPLAFGAAPQTVNGVTTINLTQHNGYFAAEETL